MVGLLWRPLSLPTNELTYQRAPNADAMQHHQSLLYYIGLDRLVGLNGSYQTKPNTEQSRPASTANM